VESHKLKLFGGTKEWLHLNALLMILLAAFGFVLPPKFAQNP